MEPVTIADKKLEPVTIADNSMVRVTLLKVPHFQCITTVKREAINEQDVTLCTNAFEAVFVEAKKNNLPLRILVRTQNVKVHVLKIKMDVVNSLKRHFQKRKQDYLPFVSRCAIVVDNTTLAGVIQPIISLICSDDRILVTAHSEAAEQFLSK